ncbi:MAG: sugar phosphate isomerase/epimerase [Armatimonadetes bacterium]|jgi:sugar phosphate isomerase/epimerase|nr:sugar phosphate isomerase/epimerase [Armatimonadota bacterium]
MAQPRVGIQLILYGQRWQHDLAGVAREVAQAGYDGIETGNLTAFYPAEQVRAILAETGLELMGIHLGYEDVADPTRLNAGLDFITAMGGSYLTCSGVGEIRGIETYTQAAATFNQAGHACRARGVTFCYHNHAWEFESLEGTQGIHHLLAHTDPAAVKLCIDLYWVYIGGEDPAQFIHRYADRVGYYHVKDGSPGRFTDLGRGNVDLPAALEAALRTDADWLVYEQDQTDQEPFRSAIESRQYLRNQTGL